MSKVIERRHAVEASGFQSPVERRLQSATALHNKFVLSAPAFEMATRPERINRELTRLQALSAKDRELRGLVGASVGSALSVCSGNERLESVHEIISVNASLIQLRDAISQRTSKQTHTLDVMLDSLRYQTEMISRDTTAFARARDLLATYAETMLAYVPDDENILRLERVKFANETKRGEKKKPTPSYLPPSLSNEDLLVPRGEIWSQAHFSEITDTARVHREPDDHDSPDLKISVANYPKLPVVYERWMEDDSSAVRIVVPTNGEPIEYKVSMVVKENGTWRRVQLGLPLSAEKFDPTKNTTAQQYHIWTKDLPTESSEYAIVVEAPSWKKDVDKKEVGSTIKTSFIDEESEVQVVRAFVEAAHETGGTLEHTFSTIGVNKDEVDISKYSAERILDYLILNGREDILNTRINALFTGSEEFTRLGISVGMRVGFVGNKRPTPIQAMIGPDNLHAGELVQSVYDHGDRKDKKKDRKLGEDEIGDKEAIYALLGITEENAAEILIHNQVETNISLGTKRGGYTDTDVRTRSLNTQPLARVEGNGQSQAEASSLIQVIPMFTQNRQKEVVGETVEATVEDMLEYLAKQEMFPDKDAYAPRVRLTSPKMRVSITLERDRLERLRRIERQRTALFFDGGFGVKSLGYDEPPISFGAYAAGSSIAGEAVERGTSQVGSTTVIAELPQVILTLTVPDTGAHVVKDKKREQMLR